MHIMESLLSTTEYRKSTKTASKLHAQGRSGPQRSKKITRTSTLTGRPRARTPSSPTSVAVFSIAGAHPALRFFPPPFTVVRETWQPVLPVLHQSKLAKKSPRVCTNHGLQTCMQHVQHSLMSCMQHTPACITCMHSRSTQITGMVTSILPFWGSHEHHRRSLVKRILFLLFWERRRNRQRALHDLTCGFLVATIDKAYQWREGGGTVSAVDTTLSPKACRCLRQAHRRRIEDTPLPSPTQTRLNACQLQVCMIH